MIKEKLAKLIDVKSIVTITLTGAFAYLAIAEVVPQEFLSIYTMIMGFYFGTQSAKESAQHVANHENTESE